MRPRFLWAIVIGGTIGWFLHSYLVMFFTGLVR